MADQPLFQGYMGTSIDRPLTGKPYAYNQVRDDLAEIADFCDMDFACAMNHFGTHSLRSGIATKAAEALVPERLFQQHGGWKSKQAMYAYVKESAPNKLSVSAALGY